MSWPDLKKVIVALFTKVDLMQKFQNLMYLHQTGKAIMANLANVNQNMGLQWGDDAVIIYISIWKYIWFHGLTVFSTKKIWFRFWCMDHFTFVKRAIMHHSIRLDERNTVVAVTLFEASISIQIKSYCRKKTAGELRWPQMTWSTSSRG